MFFDNARMTGLHIRLVLGMLARLPSRLWRRTGLGIQAQSDEATR